VESFLKKCVVFYFLKSILCFVSLLFSDKYVFVFEKRKHFSLACMSTHVLMKQFFSAMFVCISVYMITCMHVFIHVNVSAVSILVFKRSNV
jgi:hypothetical protein